jgi:hypothetical protein
MLELLHFPLSIILFLMRHFNFDHIHPQPLKTILRYDVGGSRVYHIFRITGINYIIYVLLCIKTFITTFFLIFSGFRSPNLKVLE